VKKEDSFVDEPQLLVKNRIRGSQSGRISKMSRIGCKGNKNK
jgi:hypothetical protein